MAYTFADQLAKLSVLIGDPNTSLDDAFPIAVRKKEINRGELHFARDSKAIREYATGSVSGNTLALPSDWIETHVLVVNDIVITNDFEVSISEYERYLNDSGNYWHYVWEVSGVKYITFFNSSADGLVYKLWYYKKPITELSSDTDESLLPEEYREASVYYAAAQLMKQIGKVTLAQTYMNEYAAYVSQATQDIEKNYVVRNYPRPDLGNVSSINTNRVGHGITY